MSLPCRRLWKIRAATRAFTADVVGREGVRLRALRAATADWRRSQQRKQTFSSATSRYDCGTYFIYDKDR